MVSEKPYQNFDYIDDIGNIAETIAPKEERTRAAMLVIFRLREPMIYWQMRWWHRFFVLAAFIIGLGIGI